MNNPESCSIIPLANLKLFLMNLLVVIGSKIGTKNLPKFSEGVLIVDIIGQKGGQFSIKLS